MRSYAMSRTERCRPAPRLAAMLIGCWLMAGIAAPAAAFDAPPSFAPLVERVKPAVVSIATTERAQNARPDQMPNIPDLPPGSPFEEFFRQFRQFQQQQQEQPRQPLIALGSGFIIDPSGFVVTNNHVVENGTDIQVNLGDGTSLKATLVGRDPKTDIAVLKVETDKRLPAVEFGDSDRMRIGDWVVAVGNPFGLGGTVTAGIVSARGRDLHSGPYDDFLQIDASINRGNSGGPTFNTDGQVIGMNTAILSPSGGSVGIGFAIPSNLLKSIVAQLREHGAVRRGWLGVEIQPVTPDIASALGIDAGSGALVANVTKDSPAGQAGVKPGDVITRFAGKPITMLRDLTTAVADAAIGSVQPLDVLRAGKRQTLQVTIRQLDEKQQQAAQPNTEQGANAGSLGLQLAPVNDQTRQQFNLPRDASGVVVTGVRRGSPAAERGLQPGDIILQIDQMPVEQPEQLAERVRQARDAKRKAIALLINREGSTRFLAVPLSAQ